MQLTSSQELVVNKIFEKFSTSSGTTKSPIYFKAPTGSGKTFMASEFISRVFASSILTGRKTLVVVATVSNAELPRAFAKKLEDYKVFHDFRDYKVEHIQSPSVAAAKISKIEDMPRFEPEENKVFVFGVSSFGKKSLFAQNNALNVFIQDANQKGISIVFIRDEAHIGARESIGKDEVNNFTNIMLKSSLFSLYMTATPKDFSSLVELTPDMMINDGKHLLKSDMKKTELSEEVSNSQIIDDAIASFKKTKVEYQSLEGVVINPAMLIQVSNEASEIRDAEANQRFVEGLELLERKLSSAGLKYLKYLNQKTVHGTNVPSTLEYASQNDSLIDVIIFKVGPATGWDIPRANMLLQLRDVSSEALNIQTLGRIMRNPYPGLERHPVTNKYFVYSNYQKPTRDLANYKLVEKFNEKTFYAGKIETKNKMVIEAKDSYKEGVISFLRSSEFSNIVKDLNHNKIVYEVINYGNAKVENKIENFVHLKIYNLKKLAEYDEKFHLSLFTNEIKSIASSHQKNEEIVKYCLIKSMPKLSEIKNKNMMWVNQHDPYALIENAKPNDYYSIWVDNNDAKKVNTSKIENYGYKQIGPDEDIQYLDSNPEFKFFKAFQDAVSPSQWKDINFFAKMPTLGSGVFFEYFSQEVGGITKSFMDFAIEYKDKVIMVEVKSFDNDYNEAKTQELLSAYKIYMEKFQDKNLDLILYQYDGKNDAHHVHLMVDGEWRDDYGITAAISYLMK